MSREFNLNALQTFQQNITTAGTVENVNAKIRATTIAFVENSPLADTITDSGSAFLTSGFRPGDIITVSGSTSNDGTYTIDTVTAGTITLLLNGANDLTTEGAAATVRIVAPKNVPDGISVVIKAKSGNTGNIYLSDISTGATSTAGYVLAANQNVGMQVRKTNLIFIDAQTSGEGVEVIFER